MLLSGRSCVLVEWGRTELPPSGQEEAPRLGPQKLVFCLVRQPSPGRKKLRQVRPLDATGPELRLIGKPKKTFIPRPET